QGETPKSAIWVPLRVQGQSLGAITVQSLDAENAFTESDVRLLETLAGSMAVALENARLFDETQRLLKETEARNAELAVIASVQQGMAAELNLQAIVDLVGEKLREVFNTGDIGIWWWDAPTRSLHSYYVFEHGVRHHHPPFVVPPGNVQERVYLQRETLHVNNRAESIAIGLHAIEGTDQSLSAVIMPIIGGDRVLGGVVLEDYERENAFGPDAIRLLSTVVASMGTALENARLFDETQRREREANALSEVGRDLSSTLDLSTVMDRIAAHAKELLAAQNSAIFLPDADGKTYRAIVALGDLADTLKATAIEPGRGIIGSLIASGRAEFVNDSAADARAVPIPGTPLQLGERLMVVPLKSGDAVQGAMAVWRSGGSPFEARELAFLEGLSQQAVIALNNARLFDQTQAALQRQTATADILKVIAQSPDDVQPVLDAIVSSALRLVDGHSAAVWRLDGERIRLSAFTQTSEQAAQALERYSAGLMVDDSYVQDPLRTGRPIQVVDVLTDPRTTAEHKELAKARGFRALANVPLLRDGAAIGLISVSRIEAGELTPHQVELLQTFADQAVIAIENVRLFNETKEALERQTATAEVLQVISGSMADAQPVFERILDSCERLFGTQEIGICLARDGQIDFPAYRGKFAEMIKAEYPRPLAGSVSEDVMKRGDVVHIPDASVDEMPAYVSRLVDEYTNFSLASAPMLWQGQGIGTIDIARAPPRPFTDKELALLRTFADQAVVAIQNARLFNETKEALERQTATAAILKVISESPTDIQPVFRAIVDTALRLFNVEMAVLIRREGDGYRVMSLAKVGKPAGEPSATVVPLDAEANFPSRVMLGKAMLHLPDWSAITLPPHEQRIYDEGGLCASLMLPIMRGSECIGTIGVVRKVAGAFSDKEIALMQSFVDQAVIAIENVRLFNETQEALEQQTATAEVLQVVSGSMADATPVFEKILDSCERLFGTHDLAVFLTDGQTLPQPTAFRGSFASWASTSYPRPLAGTLSGMVLERRELMYWPDTLAASEMPEYMKQIGREHGNFAGCTAPLLWEGQGIGTLNVMRRPPRPFSEQDLALLKTFADQAVIAIQNARLFNETKEALERQTATAEVLRVMSSSPADVQPVLDAVAERSAALCKGAWSTVWLAERDALHARAASAGDTQRGIDLVQTMPVPIKRTVTSGRAFVDKRFVHVEDIVPLLDSDYPDAKVNQQRFGFRTMLSVPMVREGQSIGVIGLYRDQVRPFSVAEIGLVQTFADQAVIAIENVRLFNETREALEQQTATAEILRVISGSVTDTQPVFDAIVQSCRRLFAGKAVALAMPKGDMIESVAFAGDGQTPAQGGFLRPWPLDHGSGAGSCILDSRLIAVADTVAGASRFPRMPQLAVALGYHSALFVPLLREGKAVGCLAILRAQAGEFDAQEVALAQTFADQAVIAIENARLFNETQEALERQTATSDILRVISESPADVQPVFDAIVRAGVRLFDNAAVAVSQPVGDKVVLRAIAESNARLADQWRERFPVPLTPDYMHGAALLQGRLIDVGDVLADDTPYQAGKRNFALSGYRAMTVVPMMRDGVAIGAVSVIRTAVGCLPDKQVELLKTFADQAVIAIENVRLFNETKEALEQQKASADILRVISSSVADTQPVFDKILDSCKILFGGDELDVLLVDDQERLTVAAYVGQARET
ncbi:MAG: GAF domain-containing protein, partial [Aquincola sp.]|nr:GAF domain-containing protein [Aquincola sp.]